MEQNKLTDPPKSGMIYNQYSLSVGVTQANGTVTTTMDVTHQVFMDALLKGLGERILERYQKGYRVSIHISEDLESRELNDTVQSVLGIVEKGGDIMDAPVGDNVILEHYLDWESIADPRERFLQYLKNEQTAITAKLKEAALTLKEVEGEYKSIQYMHRELVDDLINVNQSMHTVTHGGLIPSGWEDELREMEELTDEMEEEEMDDLPSDSKSVRTIYKVRGSS